MEQSRITKGKLIGLLYDYARICPRPWVAGKAYARNEFLNTLYADGGGKGDSSL